jgi:hypothetical protein
MGRAKVIWKPLAAIGLRADLSQKTKLITCDMNLRAKIYERAGVDWMT